MKVTLLKSLVTALCGVMLSLSAWATPVDTIDISFSNGLVTQVMPTNQALPEELKAVAELQITDRESETLRSTAVKVSLNSLKPELISVATHTAPHVNSAEHSQTADPEHCLQVLSEYS